MYYKSLYDKSLELLKERKKNLKDKWNFVVVGDTHLFHKGSDCRNGLDKVVNLFKEKKLDPLFIIHVGDTIHKRSEDRMKDFVKIINDDETLNKIPIFCATGNHDRIGSFEVVGDTDAFNKHIAPSDYFIDVDGSRFIWLNNTGHVENGKEYMGFSKEYLEKNLIGPMENAIKNNISNFFISMHIPPNWGSWTDGGKTDNHTFKHGVEEFIHIIKTYKKYIKVVFCGHIHAYGLQTIDNVPIIVTGGGGGLLCKNFNETIDHHFINVEVVKDKEDRNVAFTIYEI
ncbi:metallophosphoesterase family protein [Anaeromicrobium sediminis]|uniref:metallophosphoesterase family protein n=1 Tax=Anaeromicrobium sediminis TaxID=1478221 RepID=UPI001595F92D|nr:metallophosphoesterase [Anaeromicrobium sediminis]